MLFWKNVQHIGFNWRPCMIDHLGISVSDYAKEQSILFEGCWHHSDTPA